METYRSTVIDDDGCYSLVLYIEDKQLSIPITRDEPNIIKSVFNELIKNLKRDEFQFVFESDENNLYSQIGEEYIKQLNKELIDIRQELEDFDLLSK